MTDVGKQTHTYSKTIFDTATTAKDEEEIFGEYFRPSIYLQIALNYSTTSTVGCRYFDINTRPFYLLPQIATASPPTPTPTSGTK